MCLFKTIGPSLLIYTFLVNWMLIVSYDLTQNAPQFSPKLHSCTFFLGGPRSNTPTFPNNKSCMLKIDKLNNLQSFSEGLCRDGTHRGKAIRPGDYFE